MEWAQVAFTGAQCAPLTVSWRGGQGPFDIIGVWWDVATAYQIDAGRPWSIAQGVTGTSFEWTAAVPLGSRLQIIVSDTSALPGYLNNQAYVNTAVNYYGGTTSCMGPDEMSFLESTVTGSVSVSATPTDPSRPTSSSMNIIMTPSQTSSSSSSTSSLPYTLTSSRGNRVAAAAADAAGATETHFVYLTVESSSNNGTITGLAIATGTLALAFLVVTFLFFRMRRRLKRSLVGQATVGRWMNHHHDKKSATSPSRGADDAEKFDLRGDEDSLSWQTLNNTERNSGNKSQKGKNELDKPLPLLTSGLSIFTSETGSNSYNGKAWPTGTRSSGLSSFFNYRSASQAGDRAERSNSVHSNNTISTFRGMSSRDSLVSATTNPFADDSSSEAPSSVGGAHSEDHRTSTSSSSPNPHWFNDNDVKRYSGISQSTNMSDGRQSSIAPSEQASTVGGVSAISDEFYHRKKACTISPTARTDGSKTLFLDEGSARDAASSNSGH